MFEKYGLILLGIPVSLAVHGVVLWKVPELPGYLEEEQKVIEEYTEVELVKRSITIPPLRKEEKTPPEKEVLKRKPLPKPPEPPEALKLKDLESRVKEFSLGQSPKQPDVEIKLPRRQARSEIEAGYAERLSEQIAQAIVEEMEKSPLPTGEPMGRAIPIKVGTIEREELEVKPSETFPTVARLEPAPIKEEPGREKLSTGRVRFRIMGPAGKRKVISRPPEPPVVELESETEIVLKFWVLPNGEVGRAIPIKKGDPGLEAKAIGYMKKWRFDPLPRYEDQVEQEGTIPIRFTIK